MLKQAALLSVVFCLSPWAMADQLELKNGDTLQGKIVTMAEGKLIFNSPVLGELSIDMTKIKSFASDKPLKLQLVNGDLVEPQVSVSNAGFVELQTSEQHQNLAIEQIRGINPAPHKPVKWSGKLFAGASVETGNTESQDVDVDVKAIRETKRDRVILNARYEEDRSEDAVTGNLATTKRYYTLGGHYDYFVRERVYVYGDARAEKEATANLEQRLKIGGGGGYRWVETSRTRFEVESGLSWVSEDWFYPDLADT